MTRSVSVAAVFGAGGPVFRMCRRLWRHLPERRARWWDWNPWAPRYQAILYKGTILSAGVDRTDTYRMIFRSRPKGKTILDAGCHLGFYCFAAASDEAAQCTGVDICSERIREAQSAATRSGARSLEFVHADIFDYEPRSQFDVVLCLNVIHHLPDMRAVDRLADKLYRSAAERLVLIFPVPRDPMVPFERVSVSTGYEWWISPLYFEQKYGAELVISSLLPENCYGPGRALVTIFKQRETCPNARHG